MAPPRNARTSRVIWAAALWLALTPGIARADAYPIMQHAMFWSLLARAERENHPLVSVVKAIIAGEVGRQPAWKLPMLVNGLRKSPMSATITAYSAVELGGDCTTAWGSHLRRGIVAADPRYWGPGSVVWLGDPVRETVIVEDTGSAIKGPHRFDYCAAWDYEFCRQLGVRHDVTYVPLYRVPPGRWGSKPKGWHPPVWKRGIPPKQDAEAVATSSNTGTAIRETPRG